ncbi:hypothetical protein GCM10012320_14590 [Sinomonas cellulolyticus]|nr:MULTISPECIES: Rv3235 family protein [Sinomonas]GHG47647.1 hypothetical protein GCM10012320_14590 [Sinomonas sp. KCTC 49339]
MTPSRPRSVASPAAGAPSAIRSAAHAVSRRGPARALPTFVETGPRTADVVQFHRPPRPATSDQAAASRPRTDGSSALAPDPDARLGRRLQSVPSTHEADEVRKLASAITRAAMEVLAGTRPVSQLAPWLHRDLLTRVQLRADLHRLPSPARAAARSGERISLAHRAATVKAVHVSRVEEGIYEAAAVVSDAARCRAVALRIEAIGRGGWQVTALEIG